MSSRVESREQRTKPRGCTAAAAAAAAAAGNQLFYVSFTFPEAAGENERFLQEHTCKFFESGSKMFTSQKKFVSQKCTVFNCMPRDFHLMVKRLVLLKCE